MKKMRFIIIKSFTQGFFFLSGAVFLFFVIFLVLKGFLGLDRLTNLKSSFFVSKPLKEQEFVILKKFIESEKVISFDSLFTQTLYYYDTLVTILMGLLGIVVAGAFIYIKYGSEEKNKEHAKMHINNFLKTKDFDDLINRSTDKHIDIWAEDITRGFDRIEKLEGRVSSLEEDSKKRFR